MKSYSRAHVADIVQYSLTLRTHFLVAGVIKEVVSWLCQPLRRTVMIKMDPPKLFPPGTNFLINKDPPELFYYKIWTPYEKFCHLPQMKECRSSYFTCKIWTSGVSTRFPRRLELTTQARHFSSTKVSCPAACNTQYPHTLC